MNVSVKDYFTSRYGKEGIIVNADLSQIEVVMFAQLCRDSNLIRILNEGRDIHRFIMSHVYGENEFEIDKNDPRRSDIKAGTFGIIYGNGPNKLSETTGKDVTWCKDFIKTFYELFPSAKMWHKYIMEKVERDGELVTIFGQRLKFEKKPAKFDWQIEKGITESYNPPDIKNWPVQSSAGVIRAIWNGEFFRRKAIYNREKYLLINTVHDSLMLDCKKECVECCINDVQEVVDMLVDMCYSKHKVKMLVPIKAEISVGERWSDCQ